MTLRIPISLQKNMVKYYCKDNNFEKMKLTALVIFKGATRAFYTTKKW